MVIREDKETVHHHMKGSHHTPDLPKLKVRKHQHATTRQRMPSHSNTIDPSRGALEPLSATPKPSSLGKKNVTPSRIQKALQGIRHDIYNKDYLDN
jgi:hypothetical protein